MFARTERLILRPSWPEDAPHLAQALSNPDIARNLSILPTAGQESELMRWIERPRDPQLPDWLAFARTRGAPRLVGGCGITRREDGRLELGYWIERAHWGLGFATEAARAAMRAARAIGFSRIQAAHFLDNPAPVRVLRKLGFRPTGRIEVRPRPARGGSAAALIYEYNEDCLKRGPDSALELYPDAAAFAA